MRLAALLLVALALALPPRCARAVTTIRNDVPRVDTDGDIISAGDGCISYHPDEQRYYLFGAHYQPCAEPDEKCYAGDGGLAPCQEHRKVAAGQCCGWRNATVAAWSSPDLATWRKEGLDILPLLSGESTLSSQYMAVFEPCGVYNRRTGFWVLYFLRDGYVLANAVARRAAGPFDVLQWTVPVPGMTKIVDLDFWQNASTGALIMKHNSEAAGEYAVTFSDAYLTVTGTSPLFGHDLGYTEGGGIFEHGGATWVMAGFGCCFCPLGSNGFTWRSGTGVLGDYALLGDKVPRYANGTSVTHAQQFSVTPVYTARGVVPMFIGVRFGSAPDRRKDHDYQYWYPLQFSSAGDDMLNVTWLDAFDVDLAPPPLPPPPPPPPAPWYVCSLTALGACVEVPAGAPGAVVTLAACQAACVPQYACSPTEPGACDVVPAGTPGANATRGACAAACAPVWVCPRGGPPGVCVAAPAGTPGGAPSAAACAAGCALCALAGTWHGSDKGVLVRIAQAPVNATAARLLIWTEPPAWPSNASGWATPGYVEVAGGWCAAGASCVGAVTPLEAGGPQCARIDWGALGSWCSATVEPARCS